MLLAVLYTSSGPPAKAEDIASIDKANEAIVLLDMIFFLMYVNLIW